jgi:hypothetical protein
VTEARPLVLLTPRTLGELLGDALKAYARHIGSFIAIGAAVVVPVQLVVSGIGLGQLSGGYKNTSTGAELGVQAAESYLIIGPLVTVMVVHALLAVADGRSPQRGAAILNGLEAFRPVFLAVALAAAGVVIGLVLILPGIWLAIRWYFTPQAVVVDGRRSASALARSAELVTGCWWRVFAIVIVANVAAAIPASIVQIPFNVWADSVDSSALSLAGEVVGTALTAPFVSLMVTLLYFDLLSRRSLPSMVPPVQPPPPED